MMATACGVMALAATSSARSAETIPVRMIDGPPMIEVQLGAIKGNVSDVSHSRLLHGDSLWLHPAIKSRWRQTVCWHPDLGRRD